jgi:hypothetical protein
MTPSTHWIGGWVGLRAGHVLQEKSFVCVGFNASHPIVQSVVRHYTDWANLATWRPYFMELIINPIYLSWKPKELILYITLILTSRNYCKYVTFEKQDELSASIFKSVLWTFPHIVSWQANKLVRWERRQCQYRVTQCMVVDLWRIHNFVQCKATTCMKQ